MIKKLFISILPLDDQWKDFHELSLAFLVDDTIKSAYHFKVGLENGSYSEDILKDQGFTISEIMENPQNRCDVYARIQGVLDMYLNKSVPSDRALIYGFDSKEIDCFVNFLQWSGLYDPLEYFWNNKIILKSLFLEGASKITTDLSIQHLEDYSEIYFDKGIKRDSFSHLTTLINLYNKLR
jgi:hypothetical protein